MLLKGKTAVITGCLRGIGRATMDLFAQHGADIWACTEKLTPEFEQHIQTLSNQHGVTITPVCMDLFDEEQIKSGLKTIVQSKKNVDILVNIAGITGNSLFHMTTIDSMKQIFEVNFFAQMQITQYIAKLMLKQKQGSIVFISSVSAIDGNRGQVAYSASKAAIIAATKSLSDEMSEYGIRVNAIAPGVIDTEMTANLKSEDYMKLVNRTSLGRAGQMNEVASVLLFLASDLSSYVTGQVLRVDGGM